MWKKLKGVSNREVFKNTGKIIPILIGAAALFVVSFAAVYIARTFVLDKLRARPSISRLYHLWNSKEQKEYEDYKEVYETAGTLLEKEPFNNTVLTYRGYSAFFLAVSDTDSSEAFEHIDEAIRALRVALLHAKERTQAQVEYMLGKAYFFKNSFSAEHYYSDLVVEYLERSRRHGYKSNAAEYLAVSYSELGMPDKSLTVLFEALRGGRDKMQNGEKYPLLFLIADQFYKGGDAKSSKPYLFQVIQESEDDALVMRSRVLLGKVLIEEKDTQGARDEFNAILEKNENSADAHFGLGLVYEANGEMARARAEWRRVLRIQPNHADALAKMRQYNYR